MAFDFTKMTFNPQAVPKGQTMLEYYPQLELYNETGDFDCEDSIVRYASFVTDANCPLVREIGDHEVMLKEALKLAGVTANQEDFIKGHNNKAARAICRLFMVMNNTTYTYWFALKQSFFLQTAFLQSPVDPTGSKYLDEHKKRQEIGKALKEDIKTLGQLEDTLFNNQTVRKAVETASAILMINYAEQHAEEEGI